MSSIIGYILSVTFPLLSSVDFLRCYGSITECCLNVYLYVCTDNIQNIDIGTLGTCMGPYFVYVQVLGWVWFLGSRGTSLVIQWHRLPLRGHQSHFPCICSRWHLCSTLSWHRMVLFCGMRQFGDTCWCTAYHVSADALCCIIQMTYVIAFNVCFKASSSGLTFSPKPWHGIMDHFPR